MTKEELINRFTLRTLNSKTNNMIIVLDESKNMIDKIPNTCSVSFSDNEINNEFAFNIKIDLSQINIQDVLTFVLNYLKELKLLDVSFDYELPFNNKFDILKFQNVLSRYNKIVQIIFYNFEKVTNEEQMLLNELYYFNSPYFNVTSLINDNFKTYFLSNNRVLDNRENYKKEIIEDEKILKYRKK